MRAQGAPIGGDQKQPHGRQRRKKAQDAEIPELGRVHAHDARSALCEEERQQHAQRSDGAVGRDEKCADVKENRMHLKPEYSEPVRRGGQVSTLAAAIEAKRG